MLTILAAAIRWLFRHAIVFVLLVAAMAIFVHYRQSTASTENLVASRDRITAAKVTLEADIDRLTSTAVTSLSGAERTSLAAIDARIGASRAELAAMKRRRPRTADLFRAPSDAIVAGIRHDFVVQARSQEIAFLTELRANVVARGRAFDLDTRIADVDARIAADTGNIAALPAPMSPRRYIREGLALRDLAEIYAERRAGNVRTRDGLVTERLRIGEISDLAAPNLTADRLEPLLAPLQTAVAAQTARIDAGFEREAQRWYQRLGIGDLLRPAAFALLAIIMTPFAVRTLFYWVLAPLASLQRPIRLLEGEATVAIPLPTDRSGVSRAIAPGPGSELLVKQGFVQTVSQGGDKATQMLLDTRHPFSSVFAGLTFLTRIRGGAGDFSTVSATHDAFAEIAVLSLPAGAAAVLQPRAIAGVVQPIAAPLRITSHWRLGTLAAWLTWQLRFLVFHGPAEIILTGGRGVRIEPALAGRSIGQDQLIGFSTGLAYSTARTETFLPYLFGREPLLKDRVAAGAGVLIAEEAPLAGRARTGIGRGLEGAADAVLKIFGI